MLLFLSVTADITLIKTTVYSRSHCISFLGTKVYVFSLLVLM